MANRPEPELTIDVAFVRRLLEDQFPDLAQLELRGLSRGWDNTNFRLGDDLTVRVPHRKEAAPLVLNEQRCLPAISERVDLPIPAPTHAGTPTADFPWPWSVTPYFDGVEAAGATLTDRRAAAQTLGTFFRQLHTTAPFDAPLNPYRGGPLADRAKAFYERLSTLDIACDHQSVRNVFDRAAAIAPSTQNLWLHGDLHARNMIVANGELAAVIDFGDICAGDPATDLAGAFMLVPDEIATVQEYAGASEDDWHRASGWAISFAVMYLTHADDDPVMGSIGTQLLARLVA